MMDVLIRGEGIEIGEELENFIKKKVRKIERKLPELPSMEVNIFSESIRSGVIKRVEMVIELGGLELRGEAEGKEILSVIEEASKHLSRQVEKFKGKLRERRRESL